MWAPTGRRHPQTDAGRLDRQDERERRSLARLALHRYLAAVRLDVALDDREPQAGAAVLARRRGVRLEERLEDLALQLGGNADAVVGDGDLEEPRAPERPRVRRRPLCRPRLHRDVPA